MRAPGAFLLAAAVAVAQPPAIRSGGVFNAASHTPSTLPGGAIARQALFEITGVRLGSSAQTTSVTVSGIAVPLISVESTRIRARMPAAAPLGDVALIVKANGAASPPYMVRVVGANFGIFSSNQQGWGPIRAESAKPGESLTLSGTGLGTDPHPEIWVGSQRARILSTRRGTGSAADEITLRLPPDVPTGCYVPVQVAANTVTISIRAGSGACDPPAVLPMAAWTGRTAGLIAISRIVTAPDTVAEEAAAVFVSRETGRDLPLSPILLIPPPGTCATYAGSINSGPQPETSPVAALISSPHAAELDAGRLYIVRDRTRQPISPLPGAPGFYKRLLRGPGFLAPGTLTVGGEGTPAIGAFEITLPAPDPLLAQFDTAAGLTLHWPAPHANPQDLVLIGVRRNDLSHAVWSACYCSARAASGGFTVPSPILAALGSGPATAALSYFSISHQRAFQAPGLDHGLAISTYVQSQEIQLR